MRVLHGPFMQAVGLFDDINGHDRVHILLTLLGAARRVTLARDDIAIDCCHGISWLGRSGRNSINRTPTLRRATPKLRS